MMKAKNLQDLLEQQRRPIAPRIIRRVSYSRAAFLLRQSIRWAGTFTAADPLDPVLPGKSSSFASTRSRSIAARRAWLARSEAVLCRAHALPESYERDVMIAAAERAVQSHQIALARMSRRHDLSIDAI